MFLKNVGLVSVSLVFLFSTFYSDRDVLAADEKSSPQKSPLARRVPGLPRAPRFSPPARPPLTEEEVDVAPPVAHSIGLSPIPSPGREEAQPPVPPRRTRPARSPKPVTSAEKELNELISAVVAGDTVRIKPIKIKGRNSSRETPPQSL